MKKFVLFICGAFVLMAFSMKNTSSNDDIINALKRADPAAISQHFDDVLDLKLPEKEEAKNISKNQAGILFRTFYANNNINGFDLTSKREMGGTMYIAGKVTGRDKSFNITLMMHNKGGQSSIISVRIN
ncbi:MAG: DUF4783 domain-containing protein [Chitinophagaceae bacterium]